MTPCSAFGSHADFGYRILSLTEHRTLISDSDLLIIPSKVIPPRVTPKVVPSSHSSLHTVPLGARTS